MPLVSVLASLHWIQATDANFTGNYAYCILFIFSISSVYILYTGSKYCKHLHKILLYTEVFKICMYSDEQSLYGWFSTHWTTWWLQCGTGMSDSYLLLRFIHVFRSAPLFITFGSNSGYESWLQYNIYVFFLQDLSPQISRRCRCFKPSTGMHTSVWEKFFHLQKK